MPPPARSAEAFGGRALSDTDYLSSLKLGRKTKKWRQTIVWGGGGGGGGAGGSGMEQNVFIRISHLIELMVARYKKWPV